MVCRTKGIWVIHADNSPFRRLAEVIPSNPEQGIYQDLLWIYFPIDLSSARAASAPRKFGPAASALVNSTLAFSNSPICS